MPKIRSSRVHRKFVSLVIIGILFATAGLATQAATAPPDANLFATYTLGTDYQSINWIVCGSTEETEGCYDFGTLGPFGEVGAMIEGDPSVKDTTVTRDIYIVDVAAGTNGKDVELYVYRKTDSISPTFDTVTVVLLKSMALPLVGGAKAKAFLAANKDYLYVGTNRSQVALQVLKSSLSVTQIGGFSPPISLSAITTDGYGNITITFGDFTSGESGFYVYAASGGGLEDGGGASFMLNTVNGLSTATLPTTDASVPAARLGVHAKPVQQ
jgi:hypothetical protein